MTARHRIACALTVWTMFAGGAYAQDAEDTVNDADRADTVRRVHAVLSDKRRLFSYYSWPLDDAMSGRIFDEYVAALEARPGAMAAAAPSLAQYRTVLDDEIAQGRLDAAYAIADALPSVGDAPRRRDDVLQLFLNAYAHQADPGARYISPFASAPPKWTEKQGRDWSGARLSRLDVGGRSVGVIAIGSFGRIEGQLPTSQEVARMLGELRDTGVSAVVLDLRGSPGGAVTEVLDLAGLFVGKVPVVQIRESGGRSEAMPSMVASAWDGPAAVLVDGTTASGAEALAAAFQNHGRGPVVGTQTSGVAGVRILFDLDRWPAASKRSGTLLVTSGLMFRLDGRPIDVVGVVPDVVLDQGVERRVQVAGRGAPEAIKAARDYRPPKAWRPAREVSTGTAAEGTDAALFAAASLLVDGASGAR